MVKSRKDLYESVMGDIQERNTWEYNQALWYDLRHRGLRRKTKPWPRAADMHFPLADSIINKLKPFYFQQIYASELIAQFTPWRQQAQAETTSAMMWFDYQIRQQSNLETEILTTIDHMLMAGLCLMKLYWHPDKDQICFDARDPMYIIVPPWVSDIQETTRLVDVLCMSEDVYRSHPEYNQSEELIREITASDKSANSSNSLFYEQAKRRRAGLMASRRDSEIELWEAYEREGDKWLVHTFSPNKPEIDVKATYELPYDHGQLPFVPFVTEIKDKGFYSPRGIPENVASFEASICKIWNEKHDAMTVYNKPMFRSEQDMPNSINLRFQPGQVLPFGISPIPMPPPPMSFDQEMVQTRMVAEQLVGIPDYGMGQQQNIRDSRTATEISAISGLMSQTVDLRARVFRLSLGEMYRQAWSLLRQYKHDSLLFFHADRIGEITPQVLENDYVIMPSGSADGINKPLLMQKAVQRKQMFTNDPYINQAELDKSILEIDDPQLISRLLQDPNQKKTIESERQAEECLLLEQGFPVTVKPPDDDVVHIQTIIGRLQFLGHMGVQESQIAKQRTFEHLQGHLQKLASVNPQAAREITQQLQAMDKQQQQPDQASQPQPQAA